MLKKLFIGIGVIVASIIVIASLSNGDADGDDNLQLSSEPFLIGTHLLIRNIGENPVTIYDLIVNGRAECSTSMSSFVSKDLTDEEKHITWVTSGDQNLNLTSADTQMLKRIVLKTGDFHMWLSPCASIVLVKVKTDSGISEYKLENK